MKNEPMFVRHKTNEDELIEHRLMFPGKDTGWLGVGVHGNVWLISGPTAYWICDIHAEGLTTKNKKEIVAIAERVLKTDGSLERAYKRASGQINERDFRCGYRVGLITNREIP